MVDVDKSGATTLSSLVAQMSAAVDIAIPRAQWCSAEIAEINVHRGHAYMTLVEQDAGGTLIAKVRAVAFGQQYARIRKAFLDNVGAELAAGMKVLLQVAPSIDAKYGMSFIIKGIDPAFTLGGVAAQMKALLDRLMGEGLDRINKTLPSPADFTHVAVVAPKDAAGLGDFWRDVAPLQDSGLCEFTIINALFQGEGAGQEIVAAIDKAASLHAIKPLDALVIIRGGGAVTDLAWMNNYEIAKAAAKFPVQVFSGIGHERDDTVVDLVSGVRFGTPSKVSAHIVQTVTKNALEASRNLNELMRAANNLVSAETEMLVAQRQALLAATDNKVLQVTANLNSMRDTLAHQADKSCASIVTELRISLTTLMTIDPAKMLSKGYTVIRESGRHAPSKASLAGAGVIEIEFEDGKVEARYGE